MDEALSDSASDEVLKQRMIAVWNEVTNFNACKLSYQSIIAISDDQVSKLR